MVSSEKRQNKFCGEIFGYPPSNRSSEAESYRNRYICPFRTGPQECDRDNKVSNLTNPNTGELLVSNQTGACMAWNNPRWSEMPYPVIICPYRFLEGDLVFGAIRNMFLGGGRIAILEELGIGRTGTADGMMVEIDEEDNIEQLAHIEFQSDCTTGTRGLVESVRDFNDGDQIWDNNYDYGLNSKASIKGSSLQMITKGYFFERYEVPSIWVIQDYLFEYMRQRVYSIPLVEVGNEGLPQDRYLYFMTVKLVYAEEEDVFRLAIDRVFSSTPQEMQNALAEETDTITGDELFNRVSSRIEREECRFL
jgi:hypothetical protein